MGGGGDGEWEVVFVVVRGAWELKAVSCGEAALVWKGELGKKAGTRCEKRGEGARKGRLCGVV